MHSHAELLLSFLVSSTMIGLSSTYLDGLHLADCSTDCIQALACTILESFRVSLHALQLAKRILGLPDLADSLAGFEALRKASDLCGLLVSEVINRDQPR